MKKLAPILVLAALAVASCSSSSPSASESRSTHAAAPKDITVDGKVLLGGHLTYRMDDYIGSDCATPGNFHDPYSNETSPLDDIRKGAQVVITNQAGRTVAVTKLTGGTTTKAVHGGRGFPPCQYGFLVDGVPVSKFYGIKVGDHGGQFTLAQMQSGPVLHINNE